MLTSIIKIFESITQNSTCQSHSIHVIFWFFGSIFYRGFPFLFLPGFSHFHDLSKSCLVTFGVVKCVINKSFSCNDIHNCKKDEAKKKLFFFIVNTWARTLNAQWKIWPNIIVIIFFLIISNYLTSHKVTSCKYKKFCIVHKFFTV